MMSGNITAWQGVVIRVARAVAAALLGLALLCAVYVAAGLAGADEWKSTKDDFKIFNYQQTVQLYQDLKWEPIQNAKKVLPAKTYQK